MKAALLPVHAVSITTPIDEIQKISITVPVESWEPVPERPTMLSEQLVPDADVFELLCAALA